MRTCPTCKNENDDESRFCESCGAALDESARAGGLRDSERICPGCARPARALHRFCVNCGQKLTVASVDGGGPHCPGCGNALGADDAYCGWCGFRIAPASYVPEGSVPNEGTSSELRPVEGPVLTVLAGREKDKVYSLGSAGLRLGRSRENDICLDTDGYVSGSHARLYLQGSDFYVEDAGSINGTFLRVRRALRLESGDELKIGQSLFRFEGKK